MSPQEQRERLVQATVAVLRIKQKPYLEAPDIVTLVLSIVAAALCLPVALVLMLAGTGSWLSIPFIAGVIGFTLLASAHVPIKVTRRRQTRLKPAREELRLIAQEVLRLWPELRGVPGAIVPGPEDDDAWGLVRAVEEAYLEQSSQLVLQGEVQRDYKIDRGCTVYLNGMKLGQGSARKGYEFGRRVCPGTHVVTVAPDRSEYREGLPPRITTFVVPGPGTCTVRLGGDSWRQDFSSVGVEFQRRPEASKPAVAVQRLEVVADDRALPVAAPVPPLPVATPVAPVAVGGPSATAGFLPPGDTTGPFQLLAVFALHQLLAGAVRAVGADIGIVPVERVVVFLTGRFNTCNERLLQALTTANERAWRVVEMALAGESWWDRVQDRLTRPDEAPLREEIRGFLGQAGFSADDTQRCREELVAARPALLRARSFDPGQMATQAVHFARFSDPARLLVAQQAVGRELAEKVRLAGCPNLARLLSLEARPGESLLVLAVNYFFRRAVEEDTQLFQGLAFAQLESIRHDQDRGFASLHETLARQGSKLDDLLGQVQQYTARTRAALLNVEEEQRHQGGQVHELYKVVIRLQKRLDLLHGEVKPGHSLSIRSEDELILVREVVSRYRSLPGEQRQQLPALLNAVGKLEVAAGDFSAARRDFEQLTALLPDPLARAEAHHNAFHAALEGQDWERALAELNGAVVCDPARFAPFPFERYRPQRLLGAGGFGVVFLCLDEMNEQVVVKALRGEQLDGGVSRLFAEARTLERLSHPSIIRPRGHGYAGSEGTGRPYLVMDYFDGLTLDGWVRQRGPLRPEELLAVSRQVAEALRSAHQAGLLHRDVKPSNLLLRQETEGWQVRLIDFGLAVQQRVVRETVSRADALSRTLAGRALAGTLDYAAPEQLGKRPGESAGPAADVYGFGKTCCFALFGTPQPGRKHWQMIPEPMADLLDDCLRDDPAERPAQFDEVIRRLETCAA